MLTPVPHPQPVSSTTYFTARRKEHEMLLNGVNHVAILTADADRLHTFYREVFDATVSHEPNAPDGVQLSFVDVGPESQLNVFEIAGNSEAQRQTPMFGRGRIDHVGLQAASVDAFHTIRNRLMDRASTDGFVTDFGPVLSLFFTDPDGLEGEVCVTNPAAEPGVLNPPGTPAAGYRVGEKTP
jgi:catechol 2,3-dioxygenase-like lactoylglutathione lyase family enzyme